MFKRVIWMGTGMAVGAGSAFWAKRKVSQTVERYLPEQVAERAATSAKGLRTNVRGAASEGRQAMREREAELRAQVEARTFVGPPARTDPALFNQTSPAPSSSSHGGGGAADRFRPHRGRR